MNEGRREAVEWLRGRGSWAYVIGVFFVLAWRRGLCVVGSQTE